jgi:hypothetical protein
VHVAAAHPCTDSGADICAKPTPNVLAIARSHAFAQCRTHALAHPSANTSVPDTGAERRSGDAR